jgi:hypothetical protein
LSASSDSRAVTHSGRAQLSDDRLQDTVGIKPPKLAE